MDKNDSNKRSINFVKEAIEQGVPIHQIEDFLDWREMVEKCGSDEEKKRLLKRGFLGDQPGPETL